MGNLMSRVQDGTAEQAANASQRRAAGDAQGHLVKLVRVDQKGHVGAQGLEGLKERRVTLD